MNRTATAVLVGAGAAAVASLLSEDAAAAPGTSQHGGIVLPPPNVPNPGASGEAFAHSLPERPGPEREARILGAVISGDATVRWSSVVSESSGHEAVIPVLARALAIGPPGDAWRVVCNYVTAQRIADELSCVMLTPLVADLVWRQASLRLAPMTRPWSQDGTMALTSRSIEQSRALDQLVPVDAELVANEGKHWVNGARLYDPRGLDPKAWAAPMGVLGSRHNGPNYGWHQAPSGKPIQPFGLAHGMDHTDYSQMVVLMSRRIVVDHEDIDVEEVLRDPILSRLLSSEGPLPSAVHPDLAA